MRQRTKLKTQENRTPNSITNSETALQYEGPHKTIRQRRF